MPKKTILEDKHVASLLKAVQKFHDRQSKASDEFTVKNITFSLRGESLNPCSGRMCNTGFHPEIFVDPVTSEVSCRCVRD